MSIENVKKFYETLAKDDNIQNEVLKINKEMIKPGVKPTEKEKDDVLDKIVNIAKRVVGDVSLQDFKSFEKDFSKNLSSEKLENIGGGVFSFCVVAGVSASNLQKQKSSSGKTADVFSDTFVLERGGGAGICLGLGLGAFGTTGKEKNSQGGSRKSSSWCIGVGI